MSEAAPLLLHSAVVLPEWVDYNGHMSEAYYVLVFGHATDAFMDLVGIGDAVRRASRTSLFTVECHIRYLREAHEGAALNVATRLLGHDAKRVHLHHEMLREADRTLLATSELMLLHVDQAAGRAAPMPAQPLARLADIAADHDGLARPAHIGRAISMGGVAQRAPA
jgi:acyl-CoA thioester hydrolase